jgi:erythrin-vacuolar iron transport family protein
VSTSEAATGTSPVEDSEAASVAPSAGQGPQYHTAEQRFILQVIQPGLVGLMDGSVSTLAPLFAAAFATGKPYDAFLVGLAAAVGAGISMAFSEAMSDTGELTGRGRPVTRGAITGFMTFVGGVGHTLPFLIPNIHVALTLAYLVVGVELVAIAYVRYRFFKMNFFLSMVQVVIGGALVFAAGVLIGSRG